MHELFVPVNCFAGKEDNTKYNDGLRVARRVFRKHSNLCTARKCSLLVTVYKLTSTSECMWMAIALYGIKSDCNCSHYVFHSSYPEVSILLDCWRVNRTSFDVWHSSKVKRHPSYFVYS